MLLCHRKSTFGKYISEWLNRVTNKEKVHEVIKCCVGDKDLGLDGFTLVYCWIKSNMMY